MFLKNITENLSENGYCILDNFLPMSVYASLRGTVQQIESEGLTREAKIGPQSFAIKDEKIRSDRIFWIDEEDPSQATQLYFQKINTIKNELNRSFFLGLDHCEAHFAIYQPGSFYKRHVDQFANKKDRRISCVYYLNEEWMPSYGGELCLYNTDNELIDTCLPLGNRFICFESHLPHEVTIAHQTRYSIATWIKQRP